MKCFDNIWNIQSAVIFLFLNTHSNYQSVAAVLLLSVLDFLVYFTNISLFINISNCLSLIGFYLIFTGVLVYVIFTNGTNARITSTPIEAQSK